MQKKIVRLVLACVAAACLPAGALAAKYNLKLGHAVNTTDGQHAAAVKMAELVKQRSNGEVEITVFPSSTLGTDAAMISGARGGAIDIVSSGASNYNGIVPATAAFELPFVFRNAQHAYAVLDGPIGTKVLDDFGAQRLKGLAYWENGWRAFTNGKRPVRTPEDLKGLKIRSTPNPYHIQAFKLLGMNPSPLAIAELYSALETGAFDAQEHPINVTLSNKFYEVQKYLTVSNHIYSPLILVMNKARFDSLPPEYQNVVVEAAREASRYQRELNASNAGKWVDELRKAGMQVVDKVDMAPFQKIVSEPIARTFSEKLGPDLLKAIENTQ
ncbi:TRAP transporter substrate-binding protein [Pseudorhodoferax soli]|uniref:Tripartite ATP-independent transporter DctP family solute receptor n=1 Tax=Pseudorhodoferax soli TaxID=545864 RepID=A0A368YDR8_9BURK|nr:TRAP transporter substrate-binding protein [Pseudorhodoferax soli]RCW76324.1 tripartite ATP-independent transporter DctP family solute receptor [Pseudorhodoferax soli]